MDNTRATIEEEKRKIVDRFFRCAESPIKEWLAEYDGDDITQIFPDYKDDSDVIGFKFQDRYYTTYLVVMEPNQGVFVDEKFLKDETARKAISQLFDAVCMVLPSVTATAAMPYKDRFKNISCNWMNDSLAFHLKCFNIPLQKAIAMSKQLDEAKKILSAMDSQRDIVKPEMKEDFELNYQNIKKILDETIAELQSVNKEEIDKVNDECTKRNEELKANNWLYIAVEEVVQDSDETLELGLSRLPLFGLTYQDPDEDSLVDKLKKEFNVI